MAAWLAYLKSRLLLPRTPPRRRAVRRGPRRELAFQLARLEAMREAAARLMARDRLGRDVFARGAPEAVCARAPRRARRALIDLLQAYARIKTRDEFRPLHLDARRCSRWSGARADARPVGTALDWTELAAWLPEDWRDDPKRRRSAMAASFAAALELARSGAVEIRQEASFAADLPAPPRGGAAMNDATHGFATERLFAPPACPSRMRMVEAVLFASPKPLTGRELAERLPEGCDVAEALAGLRALCRPRRRARARRPGLGLPHRADLGHLMHREVVETRKLSRAAIETLAIVAYHQPVTRAEIEEIRGVAVSGGTLDLLMELGWMRLGRRRDTPGRPATFVVTTPSSTISASRAPATCPGLASCAPPACSTTAADARRPGDRGRRRRRGGSGPARDALSWLPRPTPSQTPPPAPAPSRSRSSTTTPPGPPVSPRRPPGCAPSCRRA
jgi:segregation and condensation protein B